MELTNLHLNQLQGEIAKRSLYDFYRQAWGVLEPTTYFHDSWIIEYISEHLELVSEGKIKRLCINISPRSGKSNLISIAWPVWSWLHKPSTRYLFTSYSQSLSTKHSTDRRTLIQSNWFNERYNNFQLAFDNNQKQEFSNNHRGHMIATSVGGTSVGRGGSILVLDDPLNPLEALSDTQRTNCNDWIKHSFFTRLDDKDTGSIVIVMQRLHENDPVGEFVDRSWVHIKIPAISEENKTYTFPKSGKKHTVKVGDILTRESKEALDKLKQDLGSYQFSNQYLQEPAPLGGGLLRKEWFGYYEELPRKFDFVGQSWDLAFTGKSSSDYCVGQIWGRKGNDYFLIDMIREHLDFPAQVEAVKKLSAKYPMAISKLVEAKASGSPLIDTLKSSITGLIPINPESDKVSRVALISPIIESGHVFLPKHARWLGDFILECSRFPRGRHDDMIDAMSQFLSKHQTSRPVDMSRVVELNQSSKTRSLFAHDSPFASYGQKPRFNEGHTDIQWLNETYGGGDDRVRGGQWS